MTSNYAQGSGGAGGKLRRNPPKRHQSTPYARPPFQLAKSQPSSTEDADARASGAGGGWLSRIVDPAYRLISGGATRILPSFLSKSSSVAALPASDGDTDVNNDANCDNQDEATDLGSSRSLEKAAPSRVEDLSVPDLKQGGVDGNSSESGISEIEQLIEGKLFSRDEINRLTEILHSRADRAQDVEGEMRNSKIVMQQDPSWYLPAQMELPGQNGNKPREHAPTTPRCQPTALHEVGASPIDIARAYMGSLTSDTFTPSRSTMLNDIMKPAQDDGFSSKSMIAPNSTKPSICWPGAVVQEHHGYLTPQNPRSKYGLHSTARSPYARTVYSRSKLKPTHQPVDRQQDPIIPDSPFRRMLIPGSAQNKDVADASVHGYGSVGPVRSMCRNGVPRTPYRGSALANSSSVQKQSLNGGTFPVFKSAEPGSACSIPRFQCTDDKPYYHETRIQSPHPHSSQMARRILDQIDRKVPTLKEKSEEIRIALAGQKTLSSEVTTALAKNDRRVLSNGFTSQMGQSGGDGGQKLPGSDIFGIASTCSAQGGAGPSNSTNTNALQFSSTLAREEKQDGEGDTSTPPNKRNGHSILNTGAVVQKKQQPHSFGNKPALSSIAIDRPNPSSGSLFSINSGFTFPIPASSGLLSEPPTPSITPTKVSSQSVDGLSTPMYTFSSKTASSSLDFSFPSLSNIPDQVDGSDIKFNFRSGGLNQISFSPIGKDAIQIK